METDLRRRCRIGRRVEDYRAQVATLSLNFFYSRYHLHYNSPTDRTIPICHLRRKPDGEVI